MPKTKEPQTTKKVAKSARTENLSKRKAKKPKQTAWYEKSPVNIHFDRAALFDSSAYGIDLEADVHPTIGPQRVQLVPGDADQLIAALEAWIEEYCSEDEDNEDDL